MRIPKGFSFAGVNAGVKAHRKDMALVCSAEPCSAAGVFTVSAARAAPVADAASRLPGTGFRAIVANSGNANALTGAQGRDDVASSPRRTGKRCGVKTRSWATGVPPGAGAPAYAASFCAISGSCWCARTLYARRFSATSANECSSFACRPAPVVPDLASTTSPSPSMRPARRSGASARRVAVG